MFSLRKTLSALAIASLLIVSCTPEDGAEGPVGPVGPEGQIGPAGADGLDGVSITSTSYFLAATSWTMPTGENGIVNSITTPEITAGVVENGAVLLYQTEDNTNPSSTSWRAVPYTDGVFSYSFEYTVGRIDLKITVTVNGSVPNLNAARDHSYRVVIIPPSSKIQGLDYSDYEAVNMVYGLED